MGRTTRILIISISTGLVIAIFIGIRVGRTFAKQLQDSKPLDRPANGYLDLFPADELDNLTFVETGLNPNRNPITIYRYRQSCEILETTLNFSTTGRLSENINVITGQIPPIGFTTYEMVGLGSIYVDFESFDQPDSSLKKVSLVVADGKFETALMTDSIACFLLQSGYFSVSRFSGEVPIVYSKDRYGEGESRRSVQTAVLFKRTGNKIYMLIASPVKHKNELPMGILLGLVGEKHSGK